MGKTIWFLHQYADPPDGHWTKTYELCRTLTQKGHRVTLIAQSVSHYTREDTRLGPGETWREQDYDGVRFVFLKTGKYRTNGLVRFLNLLTFAFRAYQYGSRNPENPDVVIGASPQPFCAWIAYILARQKKALFFFEVTDLWPVFLIEVGAVSSGNPVCWLFGAMEKFLLKKADKVLPLWPRMHVYFNELAGIPSDKCVWLPMGVDFSMLEDHGPEKDAKNGRMILQYNGRFGLTNPVRALLNAAKIVLERKEGNFEFRFYGEGPEREPLLQYAKDLGLDPDRVRFLDFVPKEEMFKVLREADLFIGSLPDVPHFRKYGMISSKLMDYFAVAKPVIFTTNIQDHLIRQANAGFVVPPGNPEAMADAILKMASLSGEERDRMGRNGFEYLKKNHDMEMLAERLESLIQR